MQTDDFHSQYAGLRPAHARGAVAEHSLPAARPRGRKLRVGLLQWSIYGVILSYVWRIQDLYPIVATVQFPSIISLIALAVFATSTQRHELGRIRHPILMTSSIILGLMILSVPMSLNRGLSFWFIVGNHSKTFMMMLAIAASIRAVRDVERLAMLHL